MDEQQQQYYLMTQNPHPAANIKERYGFTGVWPPPTK